MTRLERLIYEKNTICDVCKCVSFDIRNQLIKYYDREIDAIQKYGAPNPEITLKEG